ncbi:MAG: hypothetical protein ABID45_01615 [Patescibacteria group bacterium]
MHCKNCNQQFTLNQKDKSFYQSLNVPTPSWCSDCRNKRRLSIRNERTFYERKCDSCKKDLIAYYPENSEQVVYCPDCWYSDKWNSLDYGHDFDFNKSFFKQFKELYKQVPTLSLDIVNCENSEYVSYCGDDQSCYFDIAGEANERCLYGKFIKYCKDCTDNSFIYNCELCYECVNCHKCYACTWLERCLDCDHCNYSFDLRGCSHCTYCYNLRNQKYCIFNKEYSKTEYEKELAKFEGENGHSRLQVYNKQIKSKAIIKYAYMTHSENCTGEDITNSKNCANCFDIVNCENSKWLWDVLDAKDCYDLNFSLYKPEKSLELISTLNMVNSKFCNASHYCRDMEYCDKCNNSHDCFGSIGILKDEFIIFNKKYSESDYIKLKQRIIEYMKKTGEYGEFFPTGTSGFKYHETVASEYYPEDNNKLNKKFKIIKQEREFYKKMNLPEPEISPDKRHLNRNIRAGERKLHENKCNKCNIKLLTANKGSVYCEECYNNEIY